MGLMLNRRRVCGGITSLPQGAVIVQYIESDGTQRIDTGIKVNQIVRYFTETLITNKNAATAEGCTRTGQYYFVGINAQNKFYAALRAQISNTDMLNDEEFHQLDVNTTTGYLSIDGQQTVLIRTGVVNSNLIFNLFCCSGAGSGYGYYINGKKAATKIYGIDDVLLRDYIPCRIGQVGYMYDTVSGNFYGDANGGQFTPGPDI